VAFFVEKFMQSLYFARDDRQSAILTPNAQAPSEPAPAQSLLVSALQVAELLAVSCRTVWRLDSGGRLPRPVKIGGQTRWRRSEIENWIAAGCPTRDNWERLSKPNSRPAAN
jgi:predicted DNA-binding transcriptional regulator AlpA